MEAAAAAPISGCPAMRQQGYSPTAGGGRIELCSSRREFLLPHQQFKEEDARQSEPERSKTKGTLVRLGVLCPPPPRCDVIT